MPSEDNNNNPSDIYAKIFLHANLETFKIRNEKIHNNFGIQLEGYPQSQVRAQLRAKLQASSKQDVYSNNRSQTNSKQQVETDPDKIASPPNATCYKNAQKELEDFLGVPSFSPLPGTEKQIGMIQQNKPLIDFE